MINSRKLHGDAVLDRYVNPPLRSPVEKLIKLINLNFNNALVS